MAHFAKLDENNVVLQVIVVSNNDCKDENGNESEAVGIAFCKSLFGDNTSWVQTSYNSSFRGRYAGIGGRYDADRNAFIAPRPYPTWVLDQTTLEWVAPEPRPNDDNIYVWNDTRGAWDMVQTSEDIVSVVSQTAEPV